MSETAPAAPALGYSREGDIVTVRLTQDQFDGLILALGFAAGAADRNHDAVSFALFISTFNAVNAGRPAHECRLYAVPGEGANSNENA